MHTPPATLGDATSTTVSRDAMPDANARLIAEFIALSESTAHTRHRYATQVGEFAAWLAHPSTERTGSVALPKARRADVIRFLAYLASGARYAAPPTVRDRSVVLSDSARKNYLSALHSFYEHLISLELVDRNPSQGVKRPRVRVKPGLRLTAAELRRFLDAPGSPRDQVQAYLLAYTAARLNEIRCLRWRDLDFESGTLMLTGKGDKCRPVDIHPRLMPELRRWHLHEQARAERDAAVRLARTNPETDFVLLSRSGNQLSASAICKQIKRRATIAGLYVKTPKHGECRSAVSPHVLRRTFATLLLNDGHHLDAVADVLGHESVDTTRKHYAFSSNARRRATIEGLNV
jgi:site-specific recombinase XerD